MHSQRSSGSDDTLAVIALARQQQVHEYGMSLVLEAVNRQDGFLQLKDGAWYFNAALQDDVLIFGVFGSYLGDQPERFKVGAFSAKHTKPCMYCETAHDEFDNVLEDSKKMVLSDPVEFQKRVEDVPATVDEMDFVEQVLAESLGVHFRSAINDFPYIHLPA